MSSTSFKLPDQPSPGEYSLVDPSTGTLWYWDFTKNIWIKDDDDKDDGIPPFPPPSSSSSSGVADTEGKNPSKKRKKPKQTCVAVYVQNLPKDVTEKELAEHFSKCGIIREDDEGRKMVKVYRDENGQPKGDGLVTYMRRASLDLALKIIHEAPLRFGSEDNVLSISEAQFNHKQIDSEQAAKKKKKPNKKKKKKAVDQESLLSWDEETRIHVVLSHLFDPKEGWEDINFFKELKEEVREECEKLGKVDVVTVFENHPDGVIIVKYNEPQSAVLCIERMNDRWFGKRQIKAFFYDGLTNYKLPDPEEKKKIREKGWENWLEGDSDDSEE